MGIDLNQPLSGVPTLEPDESLEPSLESVDDSDHLPITGQLVNYVCAGCRRSAVRRPTFDGGEFLHDGRRGTSV